VIALSVASGCQSIDHDGPSRASARAEQALSNEYVVSIEHRPWVVSVIGDESCSGAIIGKRWVLTAYHCVDGLSSPEDGHVVAGIFSGGHETTKIIDDIYIGLAEYPLDLALLQLDSPFEFSSYISPIRMMPPGIYNNLTRIGNWGTINSVDPEGIQENGIPIVHDWYGEPWFLFLGIVDT
jgi:hypothetical protein